VCCRLLVGKEPRSPELQQVRPPSPSSKHALSRISAPNAVGYTASHACINHTQDFSLSHRPWLPSTSSSSGPPEDVLGVLANSIREVVFLPDLQHRQPTCVMANLSYAA